MSEELEPSIEELLSKSTAPENLSFNLRGFADEEAAKKLADITGTWIKFIGTKLKLEDLDAVTIAFDYKEALADLDVATKRHSSLPLRVNCACHLQLFLVILLVDRIGCLVLDLKALLHVASVKRNEIGLCLQREHVGLPWLNGLPISPFRCAR